MAGKSSNKDNLYFGGDFQATSPIRMDTYGK